MWHLPALMTMDEVVGVASSLADHSVLLLCRAGKVLTYSQREFAARFRS